MEKEFWLERWERAEIGFHQDDINPWLARYWPRLAAPPGSKVFVPLCGKSLDMAWLRKNGHPVVGVELSPIAAEAFFDEQGISPATSQTGHFQQCEAEGIRILCGDFFNMTRADLDGAATVYDRASLVALPPEMRQRYAQHMLHILPAGARTLLVTFEYDQSKMSGPPFAVTPDEVHALYREGAEVELLERADVLAQNERFKARGLNALHENIFMLTRK
ncbi:MAG TPA: thiopurine S-methyltransferase [Gallionellaceae bacterium]|nr:thiopurine S-methyltransferase [Gallionellaceae bacterium]